MSTSLYPKYNKEEFARRGNEIYERDVQPHLSAQDEGKFVAIDIETGSYEVDANEIAASRRLLARHPDAQLWFRQVGAPYTHRFGPRVALFSVDEARATSDRWRLRLAVRMTSDSSELLRENRDA